MSDQQTPHETPEHDPVASSEAAVPAPPAHPDHTAPVDLSATQELPPPPTMWASPAPWQQGGAAPGLVGPDPYATQPQPPAPPAYPAPPPFPAPPAPTSQPPAYPVYDLPAHDPAIYAGAEGSAPRHDDGLGGPLFADPAVRAAPVPPQPTTDDARWTQETGWPNGQQPDAHGATAVLPAPPPGTTSYAAPQEQRRGPGWGAVIGIAAACALVAGLIGGVAGSALGRDSSFLPDQLAGDLPTPGRGATDRPAGSVANIAATALPSVVTIKVDGADGNGTGSGFIADDQGHIITNNHVVESAADQGEIDVVLSNGDEITASIVGRDSSYDLAVIKVEQSGLEPLVIGSSADVVVGDQVIAVGAPLGLDSTVTLGIVSALNRPVSPGGAGGQSFINAIQTDAAINPGNSGGPLLNMAGEVVGVNSAIARIPGASGTQSGNIGVGFSIPSDQVRKTVEQLISTGKAEHPIIGVLLDNDYSGEGARVAPSEQNGQEPVTSGGPADAAGIEPGDVITQFEGRRVLDSDDLVVSIRSRDVGEEVTLTIERDGREMELQMTLQGAAGN